MSTESSSQVDMNHWLYRFLALVIDSIIIAIPVYIIWNFVFWSLFWSGAWWMIGFGSWLILPFFLGLIEVLYFAILEVSWGATIGKRILGLQVQTLKGDKVNFSQAFIRNISKIYWIFLLLDWLIAIVTSGADRRQKYTDRMAGTTVVQARQAFASVTPPPSQ
jgi:uncharacterized RDD family membrane protein YckC